MTEKSADSLVQNLSEELSNLFHSGEDPVIVGIETGGYWVAEALHQSIKPSTKLCKLNITFYRDDFSRHGLHPTVKPSEIPENLDAKTVILVDDVLNTGRTIRAAMNELFDFGRPDKILLAILIEREGRELPISADFCAIKMNLEKNQHVKLKGPEPLTYLISANEL